MPVFGVDGLTTLEESAACICKNMEWSPREEAICPEGCQEEAREEAKQDLIFLYAFDVLSYLLVSSYIIDINIISMCLHIMMHICHKNL
jgi:hypothetical protein